MTTPASLSALETDLRRNVSQGEFVQTPDLLHHYMHELSCEARRVQPGSAAARNLEAHATALLEWMRTMAAISLAHDAAELERLPFLAAFGSPEPRPSRTAVDA